MRLIRSATRCSSRTFSGKRPAARASSTTSTKRAPCASSTFSLSSRITASPRTISAAPTAAHRYPYARRPRRAGRRYGHDLVRLPSQRRRLRLRLSHPVQHVRRRNPRLYRAEIMREIYKDEEVAARAESSRPRSAPASKNTASSSTRSSAKCTPMRPTALVTTSSWMTPTSRASCPSRTSATAAPTTKFIKTPVPFVLSKENPYYYEGTAAKGVGSPHPAGVHLAYRTFHAGTHKS